MKSLAALVTAIIVPGGFVVLGLALLTMFASRRRDQRQRLLFGKF